MHGTGSRQCWRRARVVWAISWVAMSDSRPYRWRPPVVTRGSQSILRSWREWTYMHEPINSVDLLDITQLKCMWNLCDRCALECSVWRKWIIVVLDVKWILTFLSAKVRIYAGAARLVDSVGWEILLISVEAQSDIFGRTPVKVVSPLSSGSDLQRS